MKLGTIKNGTRDGQLVVVKRDNSMFTSAQEIAPNLQYALDHWHEISPKLLNLSNSLNNGSIKGQPVDLKNFLAPLPRAFEWVDGSAYINHIVLVRKARNAEPPKTLRTDPLVYQGGSSRFLAPMEDIYLADRSWGCDFESEVCVVMGDTPQGVKKQEAHQYVRLIMIANDVSLRNLIPGELEKGFGFFTSKPATTFGPFAVTPDELGDSWKDGRIHLNLVTKLNGQVFGNPNAGPEMHFSFYELMEHIAKTRSYTAGTILGSGTVSNEDRSRGSSCLAEKRMIEVIDTGTATTPFLKDGDHVEIALLTKDGAEICGHIDQKIVETK